MLNVLWEHFTPSQDDLKPYKEYICPEIDCKSVFHNRSNYEMHMIKRHKLCVAKNRKASKYHCPQSNCIYNENSTQDKYFSNLKYLKQHYQKVHLMKTYFCEKCEGSFISESKLILHRQKSCGKIYNCPKCSWSYRSQEALTMHMKRKKHILSSSNSNNSKLQSEKEESVVNRCRKNRTKLRPLAPSNKKSNQDLNASILGIKSNMSPDIPHELSSFHSLLRTIETQTDNPTTENCFHLTERDNFDRIFTPSTHMYTQTCDKLLSQLAPTDMQTQTNWSVLSDNSSNLNSCLRDELLVSTETQTSFTQCLLNSTYPMDLCNSQLNNGNTDNSLSLYHTQYTQTCESDIFLQELGFTFNSGDLIEGFQSTYTQT